MVSTSSRRALSHRICPALAMMVPVPAASPRGRGPMAWLHTAAMKAVSPSAMFTAKVASPYSPVRATGKNCRAAARTSGPVPFMVLPSPKRARARHISRPGTTASSTSTMATWEKILVSQAASATPTTAPIREKPP